MDIGLFFHFVRNCDIHKISFFTFSYSTGCMMNSSVHFTLSEKKGRYLISVKPDQVPEEETFHGEAPGGFPQKIESLLKT